MNRKLLHTPEGVRDIYNSECEKKMFLQDLLHDTIKKYGYHAIQTPTFEYFDIFSREIGTTPSKELYKFFDKEGETLVLRPDITPSVARCVAKYYMDEENPIRLSYMGNTFINQANYQGRLKETTQIGAELINDDSVYADGEIIALVIECMLKSGLTEFQLSIGQVDFFKSILNEAGIDEETEYELRELISNKNYFGIDEFAIEKNLKSEHQHVFQRLPELFGSVDILDEAKKLTGNENALKAIERLINVYKVVSYYGYEKYVSFDLGMLSKYKYYTGIIIKAFTYGTGEPIVAGGRYNNLLGCFGKDAPSIGFVINIDQLMAALSRQKINIQVLSKNALLLYKHNEIENAVKFSNKIRKEEDFCVSMLEIGDKSFDEYMYLAKENDIQKIFVVEGDKVNEIFNNSIN